jgi:hypothetical protein
MAGFRDGKRAGRQAREEAAEDRDSRWPLFAHRGPGDRARPNAWQVMILSDLSGPDGTCPGATDDEVFGVLGQWGAAGSWLEGRKLAVVRELIRRRPGERNAGTATGSGLPWDWDDRLAREIALQLSISVPAARKLIWAAWALEARLPGVGKALDEGRLDPGKAKMVVEETGVLDDPGMLARAEGLILAGLAGCSTWTDLQRLVQRAVVTVDPQGARKRREQEEKENARVRFWREAAGTCALMGTGLPTDEALRAHAHVEQRAQAYRQAGVRRPIDILRVAAYLDLLNAVPAADRIARFKAEDATAAGKARQAAADKAAHTQPGTTGQDDASDDRAGNDGVCNDGASDDSSDSRGARDGSAHGESANDSARDGGCHDESAQDESVSGSARDGSVNDSARDGCAGNGSASDEGGAKGDGAPGGFDPNGYPWDCPPDDGFPVAEDPCGRCSLGFCPCRDLAPPEPPCAGCGCEDCRCGGPASDSNSAGENRDDEYTRNAGDSVGGSALDPEPAVAAEVNLTLRHLDIPFITAAGLGQRAGEARSLGTLDPGLARRIAQAAARHPDSKFCLTIIDQEGHAIGHGCCKPRKHHRSRESRRSRMGQRAGPAPPPAPAFSLTPSGEPGPPGGFGSWILTLPGQAGQYAVDLHPVPTGECGHQYESPRHDPGDLLRHLISVRDGKCGFPACSRHARESDFEHAQPFDQGGRTCGCNCWACSRSCHQLKQSDGWDVTEIRPGYHQWTTPSGRTYTQEPWIYPA